jgi:hypothetical protein
MRIGVAAENSLWSLGVCVLRDMSGAGASMYRIRYINVSRG